MPKAAELYEQIRVALNEHRTDDAAQLITRALRSGPDDELRLRLHTSQAWVVWARQGPVAALRQLRGVIAQAEQSGHLAASAAAQVQVATLHARAGELDLAWQVLSVIDPDRLPPSDRVRMVMNRGTIASETGRFREAADDLGAAAALAAELDLAPLQFMATHNRGWIDYLRGDLPSALLWMGAADAVEVDLDRSVAHLDRARVLLEAGLVDEAFVLLTSARQHHDGPQQSAEIDLDLARCELLRGRLDQSFALATSARRVFARRGLDRWRRRAVVAQLRARPNARQAAALYTEAAQAGDTGVIIEAALAATSALIATGRAHQGTAFLADLRRDQASPSLSVNLAVTVALAQVSVANGDEASATRLLRRGSRTLLRAQQGLSSLDLRTAVALHGEDAAALDLRLASRRGAISLLEATERWRAVSTLVPAVSPTPDERIGAATARVRSLHAEARSSAPTAEMAAALTRAESDLRSLSWGATAPLPATTQPLTHAAIRRTVRERGTTLVSFTRVDRRVLAVVVGEQATHTVDLADPTEVGRALARVRTDLASHARLGPAHPLAAAVAASLRAGLETVDRLIVQPLELPGGPVVFVASRLLPGVPWLALPSLTGRPITLARSGSSWVSRARSVSGISAAVITGPDLPCADQEARRVRSIWHARPSDDLLTALANHDLVHVAAHGEHRSDSPLFSSLQLRRGKVFAHEFEGRRLQASHVVLSACEVGRALDRPGDQPLGFTGCLLAAGVSCVIAPVAPVADELASAVMGDYHRELRSVDAATALARATQGRPGAGAFTCFGSPWQASG